MLTEEEEVQNIKKGSDEIKKSFLTHFKANRKQILLDFLVEIGQEIGLDNNEEMKEIIKKLKELTAEPDKK